MLLGEQLGRRHEGGLKVILGGQQHGEQCHDRLARAHVAHEQPVHAVRRRHVARNLAERAMLVLGQLPRQGLAEAGGQVAPQRKCHPAPAPLGHGSRADEHELEVEQFVERQPPPALLRLGGRAGTVYRAERLGQRRKGERAPERLREHVLGQCDQRVQVAIHKPADHFVAQPFGSRIHRKHFPGGERFRIGLRVGQDHELARRHLPAMVKSDRTRHQERLPDRDGPVEERLARPDALEHAALVAQHGMKDPKPPARGQHAFGHHPPDACDLLPHFGADERRDGRRVDVAVGKVPEQVARRAYADPLQLLGPALADTLEKLDRRIEPEGAGYSLSSRHHADVPFTTEASRAQRKEWNTSCTAVLLPSLCPQRLCGEIIRKPSWVTRPTDAPRSGERRTAADRRCLRPRRESGSAGRARAGAPRPRRRGRSRPAW